MQGPGRRPPSAAQARGPGVTLCLLICRAVLGSEQMGLESRKPGGERGVVLDARTEVPPLR